MLITDTHHSIEGAHVVNAMTVDVEEHFHASALSAVAPRQRWHEFSSRVEPNTERVLALFRKTGIHATFFVLGWVAERLPALVRRIAAEGHEVASHGYGHELVYRQTRREFRDDIRRAKAAIEAAAGVNVFGYRAPSYSVTAQSLWALDSLIEEGYAYDASIFPIHHDRYGLPSAPRHVFQVAGPAGTLWEVPASTVRVFRLNLPVAGGAYFRILPYAWTRWGVRRLNRVERKPAVFYVHPWELDPDQPRFAATGLSGFRQYHNLRRTERRLRRLLREFRFAPIEQVFELPVAVRAPQPAITAV